MIVTDAILEIDTRGNGDTGAIITRIAIASLLLLALYLAAREAQKRGVI